MTDALVALSAILEPFETLEIRLARPLPADEAPGLKPEDNKAGTVVTLPRDIVKRLLVSGLRSNSLPFDFTDADLAASVRTTLGL